MTKAFIVTVIIQVLRKKHIFQEHKICTFREILIFQSHSTDGKRLNFFSLKNANFLRRFYISTKNSLEKFRHLFASYPLYDKSFYIDSNHTSFEKKSPIFRKPKFCTFREILIFQSRSTDGKRSNFFRSKNAKFLRRFDNSTNAPLSNSDICFRAIHFMTQIFTFTVVIHVLRKKTINFQKPKFCTFREILIFQSHSTDGKLSNSKPNTSVKLVFIKLQNVKETFNFRFG